MTPNSQSSAPRGWFGKLRRLRTTQSLARIAWTLALVFFVFVLANQLTLVTAFICWAFATLAVIWPTLSNADLFLDEGAQSADPLAASLPASLGRNGEPDIVTAVSQPAASEVEMDWRQVIDALIDPTFAVNHHGFIIHINPMLADVFPRARVGLPLTTVIRSPALNKAIEEFDLVQTHSIVQIEDRMPVLRKWSAIITPLHSDVDDLKPAKLVMLRDLTLEQEHARLRSDFISHASHELRTPLASLKSMVETLQRHGERDPEARDRFLAMMQTQATRMSRLIDDLLTLSRAEMRVHLPPQELCDVGEIASVAKEALDELAQTHGTTIKLTINTHRLTVHGDRDDLLQVFQNLIQNAIKYGRDGGVVSVDLSEARRGPGGTNRLRIQVTDQGDGIAQDHLMRLTERFYRVSVTASRNAGGTGLGLAIVKYIVSRHRGELQIESEVGTGSTFTVWLDFVEQPAGIQDVIGK